ncbi:MAG: DegV family protein [Clostridiales bacterium]|nr:DegV family protein [Clostridiales bacterium]
MDYKIIADSCCDVSEEMQKETGVELVPLTIRIDDTEYIDDHTLDMEAFLQHMKESKNPPKTSCPSIYDFFHSFKDSDNIFVVTLTSKLSGTYNAAMQAKEMAMEEFKGKFIHVFDSLSAVVGETLVHLKIHEYLNNNLSNNEIIDKVNNYIQEMKTFFLLESLDHLAKAGRLNPLIAKAASILSIKPIMGEDNGVIRLVDKARGYERAFKRLVDIIGEESSKLEGRLEEKVLGIAHCNCYQRALKFKELVLEKYSFKDIFIVEMGGLSSTYADQGGIVIAF